MKKVLSLSAIAALIVAASLSRVALLSRCESDFFNFYSENVRASLFSGFLSLGGFLLALHTFIVVKMKETVYEHDLYIARLNEYRAENPKVSHYGPLLRLSDLIFYSVLSCLLTALMQLTIGLYPHWASGVLCISAASGSVVLLMFVLVEVKGNMKDWFHFLEQESLDRSDSPLI